MTWSGIERRTSRPTEAPPGADLVEAFDNGTHGLKNLSHQYRCPACDLRRGGRMLLAGPDLVCKCGASLVEVNADCQHGNVRKMVREGQFQCRLCSRILVQRPR